jgi:hypothetical protein
MQDLESSATHTSCPCCTQRASLGRRAVRPRRLPSPQGWARTVLKGVTVHITTVYTRGELGAEIACQQNHPLLANTLRRVVCPIAIDSCAHLPKRRCLSSHRVWLLTLVASTSLQGSTATGSLSTSLRRHSPTGSCARPNSRSTNAMCCVMTPHTPRGTAMKKLRIVRRDFGREIAHGALTRRPPIPLYTMGPCTGGYAYDVGVWDLSIVQGPFSAPAKP